MSLPAHNSKIEKNQNLLVSLHTLVIQNRELHKEVVLFIPVCL